MLGRRRRSPMLAVLLLPLVGVTPASALPTMIRLGYNTCAGCHVSPQGGGLLTRYGKGIDAAQSLKHGEERADAERLHRLLYDVRFQMGGSVVTSKPQDAAMRSSTFRVTFRNAVLTSAHTRLSYQLGLETSALGPATSTAGATANVLLSKALFEYQPRDGLAFAVGRDALPSGLGLPDPDTYMRRQHDPQGTAYPTQAKVFISGKRLELTPYVFGPGLDDDRALRQHGVGGLAGMDLWKHRAIVGLSARASRSDAFDHDAVGVYVRLGFGRWGVLAAHDFTSRTTVTAGAKWSGYVTGYTQLFAAPFEWLVTSLIVDDVNTTGAGASHAYRVAPTAQLRLSENLTAVFSTRDDFLPGVTGRSRTYAIGIAVKSVQ